MAVILEKQRVAKRRRISPLRHNNKSSSFNTGFMSQFNQKPANYRRPKRRGGFNLFASIAKLSLPKFPVRTAAPKPIAGVPL
jgi:hypothetical protein